ncbi:hypothetical protein U1Q18_007065, partial [Sarracenia purpurea var. burkii]
DLAQRRYPNLEFDDIEPEEDVSPSAPETIVGEGVPSAEVAVAATSNLRILPLEVASVLEVPSLEILSTPGEQTEIVDLTETGPREPNPDTIEGGPTGGLVVEAVAGAEGSTAGREAVGTAVDPEGESAEGQGSGA